MEFTNSTTSRSRSIFWLVSILITLFVLSSCSSLPESEKKKRSKKKKEEHVEQVEEVPFVPLPNPYDQEPKPDVPSNAKSEYARVKDAMSAKQWEKAEGLLSLMIETYPRLSGPYVNLGIVQVKLNNFEEAEKAFKYAIELNQTNIDAYTELGALYREGGQFAEAEGIYKNALAVWPHSRETNINIGILYDLYLGRFDEALAHYELAQKLSSEPDRKLKGWIVDLKRRIGERKAKQSAEDAVTGEQQ